MIWPTKMLGNSKYFYDTYALYEIVLGNPLYEKYKSGTIVTSILNLMEFHYSLSKKFKISVANQMLKHLVKECAVVDINEEIIVEANSFRLKNKPSSQKRKFSFPDAYGYTIAKKLGLLFLTGDEDFSKYGGVEFVKK